MSNIKLDDNKYDDDLETEFWDVDTEYVSAKQAALKKKAKDKLKVKRKIDMFHEQRRLKQEIDIFDYN